VTTVAQLSCYQTPQTCSAVLRIGIMMPQHQAKAGLLIIGPDIIVAGEKLLLASPAAW
jgi:hypothetical protein